jgi:hypothetical protein
MTGSVACARAFQSSHAGRSVAAFGPIAPGGFASPKRRILPGSQTGFGRATQHQGYGWDAATTEKAARSICIGQGPLLRRPPLGPIRMASQAEA